MESPSADMAVKSVLPSLSRATEENESRDGKIDATVSPPPQRQQMQKELAHSEMLMKNRDSHSITTDDGVHQEIILSYDDEPLTVPAEVVVSVRKKRRCAKDQKKRNTSKQGKVFLGRQDKNRSTPTRELDETILKEVIAAKVLRDREPETSPMFAAMLRRIDCAGVWADAYETGCDEREPVDMEPVTVAVEATALSNWDLSLRGPCLLTKDEIVKPNNDVLGSNFVGIVVHCRKEVEERYSIRPGDRVASVVHWGSNAKYVSVPANHLISVPRHLDAADIACVIAYYLPAYETLNFGRGQPSRYSSSSLLDKKVFITTEGATMEVQALIQLARAQGSREIFVTAPVEHHEFLRKFGVATLNENPGEWLSFIANTMDVVVDTSFPKNLFAVRNLVSTTGRLICCPRPKQAEPNRWSCTPTVPSEWSYLFERSQLSMMNRAALFDYAEYVAEFRREVFEDFNILITLLSSRKLRPNVDRIITLKGIQDAYKELKENNPIPGAIICEPWKK